MENNESSSMDISDEEVNQDNEINNTDLLEPPKINTSFASVEHMYDYYRKYGMQNGFGVSKRSSIKLEGAITYITIGCCKYGKTKISSQNVLNPHPITKSQCKALIRAKRLEDNSWIVTRYSDEHNHVLSPGKARNYRCNRNLTTLAKRKLELNDSAGIRMNKNFNVLMVEAGGHENLPFLEKDCRNYIEKIRRLKLGAGDANALQSYFKKVQSVDSNFFYSIDYDEENRIKNLFWADARSRTAYEDFGDVITFDTTYLTNKYDMPFAPFVGVNHHGHSILLGCGLISSEDTESFVWLFDTWLTSMNSKPPNAIITDQDRAMQNAIQTVFPNIHHRWCLWHILKKIPEKLRGLKNYESVKFHLLQLVYDSLTHVEFEEGWSEMIVKYNLKNNDWLCGLYSERHRWVPAYLKTVFWAKMSTTQRSESINAFFDGYVTSKTTLKQFVEQYDNALRSKVVKEQNADFKSFNSWIPCVTFYAMEKQVQDIYTISKFKEFQQELTSVMYCKADLLESDGLRHYYAVSELKKIGDNEERMKRINYNVLFIQHEGGGNEFQCICKLFEFCGILCRHIILIMVENNVFMIPAQYILSRWRKDIKRSYTKCRVTYSDWKDTDEGRRYDKMSSIFNEVANLAFESEDCTNLVIHRLEDLKLELKENGVNDGIGTSISTQFSKTKSPVTDLIKPPVVKRGKGRPPINRKKSKIEQIVAKLGKKKPQLNKSKRGQMEEGSQSTILEINETFQSNRSPLDFDLNEFDFMAGESSAQDNYHL